MTWSLNPIFESYTLVAFATLAMLLVLLTPAYQPLTISRRIALVLLRLGVIAILVVLMLRPTCITTTSQPQSRMFMVLFDQSRSMQLPSADEGGTRWQQLQKLLDGAESTLSRPGEAMEVRVFAFSDQLTPVSLGQWREMKPDGGRTDLGGASDSALRQLRGRRLIGATLISDGVQTAYDSNVDVHRAARELGRAGIPLLTIPLGPPGDATQSRDVAIENLPEQLSGFVKNEIPLRGVVKVQGYVNQPVIVTLSVEDSNGQPSTVGQTEVTAAADGQQIPVRMNFTPDAEGDYKLTMSVTEQRGEMVTANNELTCYVRVRDGLKVAYVFGTVLGEQRALRWSLSSGTGVQLATRYINPRLRARWPEDHSDLFGADDIDAYVLESVPAAAFRTEDLQQLSERIAEGKGFMMLGGYFSFGAGGYQETPLESVIPVKMGKFERQDIGLDKPLSADLHWTPDAGVRMLPVANHPILQLATPDKNQAKWRAMPPLTGVNRIEPAKFASVLAVAQNDQPLLVSSQHGEGRVLAFAGDTTHRWWSRGRKEEHKRFWRQAILWLVGRDAPKSDVWLNLPRRRFQPGSRVSIRGGIRTEENIGTPKFALTMKTPSGQERLIPVRTEGDEMVAETAMLSEPGDYQLMLQAAAADGRPLGSAESSFQLIDRDIELSTAAADHQQLARLAMLTEDAGGRMLQPEQWNDAIAELLSKPPTVEIDTESRWELGANPADAWLLLGLITLLLTSEWTLRKRWGLT